MWGVEIFPGFFVCYPSPSLTVVQRARESDVSACLEGRVVAWTEGVVGFAYVVEPLFLWTSFRSHPGVRAEGGSLPVGRVAHPEGGSLPCRCTLGFPHGSQTSFGDDSFLPPCLSEVASPIGECIGGFVARNLYVGFVDLMCSI